MGFLSGTKNESVVFGQRERIGGEFVQCRIFQPEWRLNVAAHLLLAENVGDVIGAESACGMSFGEGGGDGFRAVFADEGEQFPDLARQGAIRVGQPTQILFRRGSEQRHEALLCGGTFRRGHLGKQFFLKTLGAESLSALPGAGVSDDLVMLISRW